MNSKLVYDIIRNTVTSHMPDARIMLFGSRARGHADAFSDYDILVITPRTFTSEEKIFWSTRLDRAIVEAIHAPVDLLLNSEEEIDEKLTFPGNIIRSIMNEGVML